MNQPKANTGTKQAKITVTSDTGEKTTKELELNSENWPWQKPQVEFFLQKKFK